MYRRSARSPYEANLDRVAESRRWSILFPIRIGGVCYVIDADTLTALHDGSNFLTEEITSAAVDVVDLFERLGIGVSTSAFRRETLRGMTNRFPERSEVRHFAVTNRRNVDLFLVTGNMYHGYTFKPLFTCPA